MIRKRSGHALLSEGEASSISTAEYLTGGQFLGLHPSHSPPPSASEVQTVTAPGETGHGQGARSQRVRLYSNDRISQLYYCTPDPEGNSGSCREHPRLPRLQPPWPTPTGPFPRLRSPQLLSDRRQPAGPGCSTAGFGVAFIVLRDDDKPPEVPGLDTHSFSQRDSSRADENTVGFKKLFSGIYLRIFPFCNSNQKPGVTVWINDK